MHTSVVFQRSESGRSEIRHKTHGLTQSERLVLIVMDGVTPVSEIQQKLKGLSVVRFEQAVKKLKGTGLVVEVLFSPAGVQQETYDPAVVDRFLQQDPSDPVTIVSIDADYDDDLEPFYALRDTGGAGFKRDGLARQSSDRTENGSVASVTETASHASAAVLPVGLPILRNVDFYIPLQRKPGDAVSFTLESGQNVRKVGHAFSGKPSPIGMAVSWGSIMIVAGLVLLILSMAIKLRH